MAEYYDGTKLLSLKDINGKKPEMYFVTTNRTGGKTTYFSRLCVNKFLKDGEKFALFYRFNYEVSEVADKFFKDISTLFFNGRVMTSKNRAKGIFHELYIDDMPCGYALALNAADQIKRYSHLFSDVKRIMFDEFQSETNHYCADELSKFLSVFTSIARGQGQQHRYVPVYMIGNPITLLNPYYAGLKISSRLTANTKFLKGNGFVVEQGYVESAANAQKESGVLSAFADHKYAQYSMEANYLNDNYSFVDTPIGKSRYIATLKYGGKHYAVKEFPDSGIVYCDDRADLTFPLKLSVTINDHDVNYVTIKRNLWLLQTLRDSFQCGSFRFRNLLCKEAIFTALAL